MRRWRLEDAPELRSTGGQPHERRTCPLQPQVRRNDEGPKESETEKLKRIYEFYKYYTTANVSKPQMKEKEKASTLRHQKLVVFLMVSVYVCACMLERKRRSAERSNFSLRSIKIWGLYICASILIFIPFSFSLFHGSRLCFQSRIFLRIFYIFCTLWLHQPLK